MTTPVIEEYRFGHLVVDGETYDGDVIILPEKVLGGWWRQKSHSLCADDLKAVFQSMPDVLVVGQGTSSKMKVPAETGDLLREAGIELVAQPTDEACQTYNALRQKRRTAAALHLTC